LTRRLLGLLGLLAVVPVPATAQLPTIFPPGSRVQDLWYPKLFWTARNGLTAGGYYSIVLPHTFETFDDPAPYWAAIQLDGQASVSGSRRLTLDAFAPRWVDGWRFRLTLSAQRRNRDDYFGIGNASIIVDANTDTDEFFYRLRRVRIFVRAEVQRRIVGGLRILAGGHAERWRLDPLTGTSQLGRDSAAAIDPTIGPNTSDLSVRIGLVFDTRDDEAAPRSGLLLEAIHAIGDVDKASYSRTLVSARGYLPVNERFAVSARLAGQGMGGTPRLGSLYLIEASDAPFDGIGGPESHRALRRNRFLGRNKLFANLDVFYTLFEVPTLVRVKLVGFVDAARVFEGEDFRLTTKDLHVGAGGGLLLHLFRNAVLGVTGAGGPDGFVLHSHTKWAY